jgi:hypothetical protein
MGILDEVGGILKQYQSAGTTPPPQEVATHFDQVANTVPSSTLADGIAHAIRSDQTPDFAQIVSSLFGQANGAQKAGMLSQLMAAVGPQAAALVGGPDAATSEQAQHIAPLALKQLADRAQQADPSVIDKLSGFYAQHPTLVKSLGAGALALIMSRVSQHGASAR